MSESEQLCYVIMPFAEEFLPTYRDAIRPAVEIARRATDVPLVCRRSDDLVGPSSITREIVDSIYRARVVVADLTCNNPNVFYELGIAHSAGNKTIMLASNAECVPFDVHAYRVIEYTASESGFAKLRDALAAAIVQVCEGLDLPTNPVHDFAPICHSRLVVPLADAMETERNAERDVWIISPDSQTDLKLFGDIVRHNIVTRGVTYKYILPKTRRAIRSWNRFCHVFDFEEDKSDKLQVRFVDEHQVESELVIYDPHSAGEKVLILSPTEEGLAYFYHIRGSRAEKIRDRFEDLWEEAVVTTQ